MARLATAGCLAALLCACSTPGPAAREAAVSDDLGFGLSLLADWHEARPADGAVFEARSGDDSLVRVFHRKGDSLDQVVLERRALVSDVLKLTKADEVRYVFDDERMRVASFSRYSGGESGRERVYSLVVQIEGATVEVVGYTPLPGRSDELRSVVLSLEFDE